MRRYICVLLVAFILQSVLGGVALADTNVFPADGNVGIGTVQPQATLDIRGNLELLNDSEDQQEARSILLSSIASAGKCRSWKIEATTHDQDPFGYYNLNFNYLGSGYSGEGYRLSKDGIISLNGNSGNVGIGTTNPAHKLTVEGTIAAREIRVTSSANWADYVFADDYQLRSIEAVAAYIEKNNHLPDIPSGAEIEQGGIEVSEMLAKQMQKIEELTLYVIELEKNNQMMMERLSALESQK